MQSENNGRLLSMESETNKDARQDLTDKLGLLMMLACFSPSLLSVALLFKLTYTYVPGSLILFTEPGLRSRCLFIFKVRRWNVILKFPTCTLPNTGITW